MGCSSSKAGDGLPSGVSEGMHTRTSRAMTRDYEGDNDIAPDESNGVVHHRPSSYSSKKKRNQRASRKVMYQRNRCPDDVDSDDDDDYSETDEMAQQNATSNDRLPRRQAHASIRKDLIHDHSNFYSRPGSVSSGHVQRAFTIAAAFDMTSADSDNDGGIAASPNNITLSFSQSSKTESMCDVRQGMSSAGMRNRREKQSIRQAVCVNRDPDLVDSDDDDEFIPHSCVYPEDTTTGGLMCEKNQPAEGSENIDQLSVGNIPSSLGGVFATSLSNNDSGRMCGMCCEDYPLANSLEVADDRNITSNAGRDSTEISGNSTMNDATRSDVMPAVANSVATVFGGSLCEELEYFGDVD